MVEQLVRLLEMAKMIDGRDIDTSNPQRMDVIAYRAFLEDILTLLNNAIDKAQLPHLWYANNMKIDKDTTSTIVFHAQQDMMKWVASKMASVESQITEEEKYRWRAYFDVLDYLEKFRYNKEFEVKQESATIIEPTS